MTVKSEPLTKERKASAIVTRATLDRQRGVFERVLAFGVLFFSFAGTIAALSGGWSALRADPRLAPIVGGIALGSDAHVRRMVVWRRARSLPYRAALLIDATLTTIGYAPLIVPWLAAYLMSKGIGDPALYLAWGSSEVYMHCRVYPGAAFN